MTLPPEPNPTRKPLESMVLVEYCLDCHHLAQITFVRTDSAEIEVLHVWVAGMGGEAHVSNTPPPEPHCNGRWGLGSAYVMDDDENTGDLDVVIPAIGRWYRKDGELKVYEDI